MAAIREDMALAWQCYQAGNLPEAESRYRQILEVEPADATAWYLFGVTCQVQGKLNEAVGSYEQALRLRPNYAEVYSNLGVAYSVQGRLADAVASYREAVRINPSFPAPHNNLGLALLDQGAVDEAVATFREALRLKRDFPEAHYNLGRAYQQQGELDDAVVCYRRALELQPRYVDAYNNLGVVLANQQNWDEAAACLQQALALDSSRADAYNNLGNVLKDQDRLDDAAACFRRALELRPEYAEAYNNLAVTLDKQGKPEDAQRYFSEAVRLDPGYVDAHANLGALEQQLGNLAAAQASVREALRLNPRHVPAFTELVGLLEGRLTDGDLATLCDLLTDPLLSDDLRSRLHFRAAEVCDVRGEYREAAEHLQRANVLQTTARGKSHQAYDPAAHTQSIERVIGTFTPEFFEQFRGWGLDSERPIFIFGLPRSGTTLVEQILASHSQVHGAGELGLGQAAFNALPGVPYGEQAALLSLGSISRSAFQRIGEENLARLQGINASATRVVDKMPDNYLHLGLLAALFPRARFIHTLRDVRDVAASCWVTNFLKLPWANELAHIALRIRDYRRLMKHWRRVLPVPMVEVSYESVVATLETEARRLVAGCGLEWEPACLAFYQTRRPVRTASILQVRQPIYSRSVGRWRHYANALAPLLAQLEADGM
jgi:tetratricopeptide (TPR) repeat protein